MKRKVRRYNEEERWFLLENVYGHSYAEIIAMFNQWNEGYGDPLTESQLKAYIKNHHMTTGRTGQFEKGQTSHNKGKKKTWAGGEASQFQKGHTPANHRPVGSARVNVDGYIEVKVKEPKTWRKLHVLVWEEANGPVPKGHVILFGDGNKQNVGPDNLILVTRAELAMLNKLKLIGNSAELTKTGVLVADLRMKMYEKKKGRKLNKTEK